MKNKRMFRYSCVNVTNKELCELEYIIDNMDEISGREFKSKVDRADFQELLEALGYSNKFPVEKDWHVGYFKCLKESISAYVFRHSAIEYVFY